MEFTDTFGKIFLSYNYRRGAEFIYKLLIATGNENKVNEIKENMTGLPIEFFSLKDLDIRDEIEETGKTFTENAVLKATGYAKIAGIPALADDSGLEVSALDGRPGVFSARYGGSVTPHEKKMQLLLKELSELKDNNDRSARFLCSLALSDPDGVLLYKGEGECRGIISDKPLGNNGFGYDPIFIPDGYSTSFGELSSSIKQKISHRSRAIENLNHFLSNYLSV